MSADIDVAALPDKPQIDLLDINEALEELEKRSQRRAEIIQLIHFGGFSLAEIAKFLNISVSRVKQEHLEGKRWLRRWLSDSDDE